MLSAPTLSRLASLAAFLNTAPGLRGGQPADERFTAATARATGRSERAIQREAERAELAEVPCRVMR